MIIANDKCRGCGLCVPYCITSAISIVENKADIDSEKCVECGVCQQVDVCKFEAIEMDEIKWPRLLRRIYSNVVFKNPKTGMTGRGTPEMKTNEVTGKYKKGEVGLGIEVGRPDVCTSFRDINRVSQAVAKIGVEFDLEAPTTDLMEDVKNGVIRTDILDERVICAIIECKTTSDNLPEVLETLLKVSQEIDTVFSLAMITVAEGEGDMPNVEMVKRLGFEVRPNAKTTVGLGRPLYKEVK